MVCFATQRNREKIMRRGKQRRKHTSLWRRLFFRFLGVGLVGLFDPLLMNWSQLSLLSTGRLPPLRGSYKEKWGAGCFQKTLHAWFSLTSMSTKSSAWACCFRKGKCLVRLKIWTNFYVIKCDIIQKFNVVFDERLILCIHHSIWIFVVYVW